MKLIAGDIGCGYDDCYQKAEVRVNLVCCSDQRSNLCLKHWREKEQENTDLHCAWCIVCQNEVYAPFYKGRRL